MHLEIYILTNICRIHKPLSKRPKIRFQYQLSLNAGQKYCRMLEAEHSAILSTFITLPFVIKTYVLSIFEWPFHRFYCICMEKTTRVQRVDNFNEHSSICCLNRKTCLKRPLKIDKTKVLTLDFGLMQVESIAKCSLWSILQYF